LANSATVHFRAGSLLLRHPELQKLAGHSYLTGAIIFAIVAVQLVIAALIQAGADAGAWTASWWFVAILAYAVGATLNHWEALFVLRTAQLGDVPRRLPQRASRPPVERAGACRGYAQRPPSSVISPPTARGPGSFCSSSSIARSATMHGSPEVRP
jgi:hypothetical protein